MGIAAGYELIISKLPTRQLTFAPVAEFATIVSKLPTRQLTRHHKLLANV